MAAKKSKTKADDGLLGIRAYGRHRGCSHTAVIKARKEGRLVRAVVPNADGKGWKVNVEIADLEWAQNTSPIHDRSAPPDKGKPKRRLGESAGAGGPGPANDDPYAADSIRETNAEKIKMQVRLLELQFLEKAGSLIDAKKVRSDVMRAFKAVRDALITLPDRMAPELAGVGVELEVRDRLDKEIRSILKGLGEGELW